VLVLAPHCTRTRLCTSHAYLPPRPDTSLRQFAPESRIVLYLIIFLSDHMIVFNLFRLPNFFCLQIQDDNKGYALFHSIYHPAVAYVQFQRFVRAFEIAFSTYVRMPVHRARSDDVTLLAWRSSESMHLGSRKSPELRRRSAFEFRNHRKTCTYFILGKRSCAKIMLKQ
jgi:hypothetical protein